MLQPDELIIRLNSKPHWLLDGAIGTELERRGYRTSLPFWTAFAVDECPELLADIHTDYLKAGVDIISANTFRISKYLFEKADRMSDFLPTLQRTLDFARNCIPASSETLVAASLAPLEDCYRPDLTPPNEMLIQYHKSQIEALSRFNFDFILAETINSLEEAVIICRLCHSMDIALMISLISDGNGAMLSGVQLGEVLCQIAPYKPAVVSLNCRPTLDLIKDASILKDAFQGFKGIYPNAPGSPGQPGYWDLDTRADEILADFTRKVLIMGFRIIGGCCGTTPAMIKIIHDVINRDASVGD